MIGSAIAWRAAEAGLEVTLVDTDPLPAQPRSASWAAAGMLTPVSEAHYGEEALLELNLASAAMYPEFIAELQAATGADVGYRRCGTVVVARDPDDNAALDDLFSFHQRLGLSVRRLRAKELRGVEPHLSPRVRGGILVEGDHQVDNRALLQGLQAAAGTAGAKILSGRVTAIEPAGDAAHTLTLATGGTLEVDAVALAAGVWTQDIEGIPPELSGRIRPVKGQLLHLRGPRFLEHNVRGLDVYIVPRSDGRVVVGATMEERGFDDRPTAEAAYELLHAAYELVPGILELESVAHEVGFRPATPDNAPMIGPSSVEGIFVATGHFRNGVLLAPVTAIDLVACMTDPDLYEAPEPPERIAPFSPLRFSSTAVAS